jgi:hypothetical protein
VKPAAMVSGMFVYNDLCSGFKLIIIVLEIINKPINEKIRYLRVEA